MDQPSPEELQAYVEQLRTTDPRDIVAQAFSMLGTSAEVKLGTPDARVLIDAMAGILGSAGPSLPELAPQMESYVGQLKMAQVQMEAEARAGGGEASAAAAAQPGQATPPTQGPGPAAQPGGPGQPAPEPESSKLTDRLWIPGRGGPPPKA